MKFFQKAVAVAASSTAGYITYKQMQNNDKIHKPFAMQSTEEQQQTVLQNQEDKLNRWCSQIND